MPADPSFIAKHLTTANAKKLSSIVRIYRGTDLRLLPEACPAALFSLGLVEAYPIGSEDEATVSARFTPTQLGMTVADLVNA